MLKFKESEYIIESPSDFKIEVKFIDKPINTPFKIIFFDLRGNDYIVANDGVNKLNCVIKDNKLYFIFQNYKFANCYLRYTEYISVEDNDFADGRMDTQSSYKSPIRIINCVSKIKYNDPITAVLDLGVIRGYSAYEIAVENGYSGTEAEWLESLIDTSKYYNKKEIDDKIVGVRFRDGSTNQVLGEVFNDVESNQASELYSHAEGCGTRANGKNSHAEGKQSRAYGENSHAEGYNTGVDGKNSHAEGNSTEAYGENQHVQGRYNEEDNDNKYADIVGGGTDSDDRKNIETTSWGGVKWLSSDVRCGGENQDDTNAISLVSIFNSLKPIKDATGATVPQVFIDMWNNAAGIYGKWNVTTGYFELNGLTDITYQQALAIYESKLSYIGKDCTGFCGSLNIRTNILFVSPRNSSSIQYYLQEAFSGCKNLEIVKLGAMNINSLRYTFERCLSLVKIIDVLNAKYITNSFDIEGCFSNCNKLQSVNIRGLSLNLSLAQSPSIDKKSLVYMLQNRANAVGIPITITLHQAAYAKYSVDADVQALLPATSTQGAVNLASA